MLYIKAIEEISWQEIVEFCKQGIPEGAYLDYKQDFPKNLQKTISAMANTLGGIILVGIVEDDENKPVLPLKGIPFQRGLSERVMNIILTNITPPVFPEIQVCLNSNKSRAIVVVRIAQSHQTPHAISNNTQVYLRTGNRNKPEALAVIDQIEWLKNQRQKSLSLRERLYSDADQRFINLYTRNLKQSKEEDSKIQHMISQGRLTLSLCPVYPKDPFCIPPDLDTIMRKIRVRDYYGTSHFFPLPDTKAGLIVQNGIVLSLFANSEAFYTEVNCFGLYFYRQTFRPLNTPQEEKPIIPAGEMASRIDQFIGSGIKYYEELGYWGTLLFCVHLDNILECALNKDLEERYRPFILLFSPDKEVQFTDIILAGSLEKEKHRLTFESIQRIGWTFDWDISPELLNHFFKDIKR